MKKTVSMIMAVTMIALMLTACNTIEPQSDDMMKDISRGDPQIIQLYDVSEASVADFAVRLFKESSEEGQNTLISPLSVLVALSMTANGADNNTLAEMEAVLGMPVDELNSWIYNYMTKLPENEKYKLSLANSIWLRDKETFKVNEDFLQTNADYYSAGIYKAPFDESTCREINKWVEDNTDGMIKNILDQIPDGAVMYLINALAFDAEWLEIYKNSEIRNGDFTLEDGTKRKAELMYSKENQYIHDDNATGFIKYYKDRKYAFAALLPNEGVSVSEYIASLDGNKLYGMLKNAETTSVMAAIPKFETEYKVEMSDILIRMGMRDAFDGGSADLSKIGSSIDGNLYISRVIHQTYINVDGKGTKAGAATAVTVYGAGAPQDVKEVNLDRPFVYMIMDMENNLPVFMGTLMSL